MKKPMMKPAMAKGGKPAMAKGDKAAGKMSKSDRFAAMLKGFKKGK